MFPLPTDRHHVALTFIQQQNLKKLLYQFRHEHTIAISLHGLWALRLKELDVNNERHEEHDGHDGAVLAVHGLQTQLLGAPLEVLGPVREIGRDARDVYNNNNSNSSRSSAIHPDTTSQTRAAPRTLDALAPVEHFLDVLAHDVVDVGQIVVQAMHVLGRVGVRVLLALLLDELVCGSTRVSGATGSSHRAERPTHQT